MQVVWNMLPTKVRKAFIAAMEGDDEQEFRQRCLNKFRSAHALDVMIDTLQSTASALAQINKVELKE